MADDDLLKSHKVHHTHHFKPYHGHYRYHPEYFGEIWDWFTDRCEEGGEERHHVPPQKYKPGRLHSVEIILGPTINCNDVYMGVITDMGLALLTTEKVVLTAVGKDADGNVTADPIRFAVDDASLASLVDNGDGTAVVSGEAAGTANVTAIATNTDGNEITSDPFAIDVTESVVATAPTATVEITAGAPEPK